MKKRNVVVRSGGGMFVAIGIYILVAAHNFPMPTRVSDIVGPRLMPEILAILLIFLGGIVFLAPGRKIKIDLEWKGMSIVLIAGIAYVLFLPFIGFILSTLIILALLTNYLNRPHYLKNTLISIALTGLFYLIFVVFLHVSFP